MELVKDLPEIFEEFNDARKNSFIAAKELKDKGKPIVGVFCTFLPQEIPLAMNAAVVSLCATSDETISDAERDLPRNLCPLIKSSYGFAKTDKCPFFYFSDIIIGETTCDGKKKMFEYLEEFKPVHVMELPNTTRYVDMWQKEIVRFREALEEKFEVKITEESIKEAIKLKNRERKALKAFYELGKLEPLALKGQDLHKVLYGSSFKFDKEEAIKDIEELTAKIKKEYEEGKRLDPRPRILITGCPIGGASEKVIKAIEDNGAYVVAFENCSGLKTLEELVDEENENVYEALAKKYIEIGCSCMSPNNNRLDIIRKAIDDFKVDAVVDVILQACHTYNVETLKIKRIVNEEKGKPYMSIETDYSSSDIEQLNTRMAAFIEMI